MIVVVHGAERDGERYWRAARRAARKAGPGAVAESYIIAPQFLTRRDARTRADSGVLLTWTRRAWKSGDPSSSSSRVSSFAVLDAILERAADRKFYPGLESVIIVGHSAGAQLVHRYAAAGLADDRLRAAGLSVRYVVVNPSSYLYLDTTRPWSGGDRSLDMPPTALVEACPHYNHYKYGLELLSPYLEAVGQEAIKRQYGERNVVYIVGAEDDDPDDRTMDSSCAAMLQGRTRIARARAYYKHLLAIYGDPVRDRHVLEVVPRVGHEGPRILRSRAGLKWLFDIDPAAPLPSAR